jgi:photosystem II stability/assembly factor-like uncharacterized protein
MYYRIVTVSFLTSALLSLSIYLFLQRYSQPTTQSGQNRSESREALDFFTDARAYPKAAIPESGIAAAFEYSRSILRKKASVMADLHPWRALGPQNVGGRTLAIALNPMNPTTIYAGSASGGLWRSFTGGVGDNAWEYLRTGFPVLGVASIAIAPEDSNTIYIGTGEVYGSRESFPGVAIRTTRGSYGIGILKTTDGGKTWVKSLDWLYNQRRGVQKIRINPKLSSTVWAATTEGTYKSTDAGVSWQQVSTIRMATDIAINPVDTNTVFVATGGMGSSGHGIYRTKDGGATWQKMNLGPNGPSEYFGKAMLAISQSNPDIVMASIGNSPGTSPTATWLAKTTDGGDSWQIVSTIDYSSIQGWYSHDVAIHPTDPDEVWCAGQPFSALISTDGGPNLQFAERIGFMQPATGIASLEYPDLNYWADYHEIVYHPTDPEIIYFACDGGVFRTTDGGRTTENCNGGYQTTQFYNGTSSSDSDSAFFIGGKQDNMLAAYDGELFWRRIGPTADGSWTAINRNNNNIVYLSTQFLSMRRYSNRGSLGTSQSTFVSPPGRRSQNFIAPFVLSPVDNRTLYAGSALVHRSANEGGSWTNTNNGRSLDGNPVLSMAASYQSADVVYVGTTPGFNRAHIFRTVNGGNDWVDITGNLPDRFPLDLAVDPGDDQNVYITFGGFGSSHAFKSEDGGNTWIDIGTGLPDVPAWAVIVDPDFPNEIYIGNDLGVYYSPDGGSTWVEFTDGLPDAIIAMDLTISQANRSLRVATHGNGVYERKLVGGTATAVAAGDFQPADFRLEQNYPNPFNPATTIRFSLKSARHVTLTVYDLLGREVVTLVEARKSTGTHEVAFDATAFGSSSVYFYRLRAGRFSQTRKMVFAK